MARDQAKLAKWKEANKEHILERNRSYARAYRERNRERVREWARNWYRAHGDRKRAQHKAWRERNPERKRASDRRTKGLPEPLRPAPDGCELCGRSTVRALNLDHCHETGKFRGWLCGPCNTGIGKLGDNVAGLERAIEYLRRSDT